MGRKRNLTDETIKNNMFAVGFYTERLTEIALSMFEWKNLPDTIDERYLELCLFNDGQVVFFNDEVLGYLALNNTNNGGKLSVYNVPLLRRAFANNGYNHLLSDKNSVIIYNNYMRSASIPLVSYYAGTIADIDLSIRVNARAQKTPVALLCEENQRLSILNTYQKYDGNEPVILGTKNLDLGGITSIRTDTPFVADKLYELKNKLWNEALTHLGVSNVGYEKKERLLQDEVLRSQGGTIASRYPRLEMRRKACKEINKMFGLNIWCDYRKDYQIVDDVSSDNDSLGGEDNE